jgi:hypothetical protein
LVEQVLGGEVGREFQKEGKGHSSVDDALATMVLYRRYAKEWEGRERVKVKGEGSGGLEKRGKGQGEGKVKGKGKGRERPQKILNLAATVRHLQSKDELDKGTEDSLRLNFSDTVVAPEGNQGKILETSGDMMRGKKRKRVEDDTVKNRERRTRDGWWNEEF